MIAAATPIDADELRLRHEFLEMPGLVLSPMQVSRLFDIRQRHAEQLLAALEADGFLARTPWGTYRRAEPPMA